MGIGHSCWKPTLKPGYAPYPEPLGTIDFMMDQLERIKTLSNDKLIDVVKNYRQYGYSDELRNVALEELQERGIDREELQLLGNLENHTYNRAESLFQSFTKNSKIAFVLYLLILINLVMIPVLSIQSITMGFAGAMINWVLLFSYVIFMVMSFMNQINFYRAIGKEYGVDGAIVFFVAGMPLYAVLYFYFRRQMKEQMSMIGWNSA